MQAIGHDWRGDPGATELVRQNHQAAEEQPEMLEEIFVKFDVDQTVGAGQDNYVMTYDNATGKISLEAASGGAGGILNTAGNTGTGSVTLASETLQVLGTTGEIDVEAAAFALSLSLADNISGILTLTATTSVTGGSIILSGGTIDTTDSSHITIPPAVVMQSDLTVQNVISAFPVISVIPHFRDCSPQ